MPDRRRCRRRRRRPLARSFVRSILVVVKPIRIVVNVASKKLEIKARSRVRFSVCDLRCGFAISFAFKWGHFSLPFISIFITSSVAICWNKKLPNFPQKLPNNEHQLMYLQSDVFISSLEKLQNFVRKFVAKNFRNSPNLVTLITGTVAIQTQVCTTPEQLILPLNSFVEGDSQLDQTNGHL